jgi:hypothetical protein
LAEREYKAAAPTVPQITTLLEDESAGIRAEAARAMRNIGPAAGPAAVPLAKALKDQDEWVRIRAAEALVAIGPTDAAIVPALVQALEDQDDRVRASAAHALGSYGPMAKPAGRVAQEEVPAKRERNERKRSLLRSMVEMIIGGAAGVLLSYYLMNLFGGPKCDFARIYLPGIEHTATYRPTWWPDWLKFERESTSDVDREGAKLPDTTPAGNATDVAAETSESTTNTTGIRGDTIRVWKDNTGQFQVEAEYLNVDDEGVCLRKTDGQEIKMPLGRLSHEDQTWLEANASLKTTQ